MFELRQPELLALLAVAPALWWLHRLHDRGIDQPVAALFLWQTSATDMSQGIRLAAADPAWRRRVSVVVCACMAMAGPLYLTNKPAITVWVDDSPSMFVAESGATRLALAADELARRIGEDFGGGLMLRSLGDPTKSSQADNANALLQSLRTWPVAGNALTPPPPALMDRGRRHWLISDGADPDIAEWSSSAPLSGVVQIGSEKNNAAVTAITARASASDMNVLDVRVHIGYSGTSAGYRTVNITGVEDPGEQRFELAPGASRIITATALRGRNIEARLDPPDPLPMDDSLILPASASAALKVRVIGDCPGALVGALAAIPKLDLSNAPGQPADLLVACAAAGALPQTDTAAMFFVTPESQPQQFRKPVWSTLAGPLQNIALEDVAAEVVDRPVGTAATPLLSSGRGALISLHREADRAPAVYVGLDIADAAWARQPSYALLIARLAELAAGQLLLDPIDAVARGSGEEEIAPRYALAQREVDVTPASTGRDIAAWFIFAALLLVLLDLAVLIGTARRAAAPAAAAGR
ncbi:MAG: hypothetical protein OES78_10055 [Chromatiales bacterium]|nr:hypothetical protein [Chromatiales bacterium]